MAEGKRTCPQCGLQVVKTAWRCPGCGGALTATLDVGRSGGSAPAQNLSYLLIAVLFIVFLILAYQSWIYPNAWIDVEVGEVAICTETGERTIKSIEKKRVRRKNRFLPTNSMRELYVSCEAQTTREYSAKSAAELEPKREEVVVVYESAEPEGRDHDADVNDSDGRFPSNASNFPYATLATNMTPDAVVSAWGDPVMVEYVVQEGKELERWYYGDPLYGIMIHDRYVDFRRGRLVEYHLDNVLDKLYRDVMDERRLGKI